MELFKEHFRLLILIVTTFCLAMMLANILTVNYTIRCLSEEKFHYENFSVDLGFDIFERVDFEPKTPSELPETQDHFPIPDIQVASPSLIFVIINSSKVPGIHFPSLSLNWQHLKLARHNPQLFLRLLKKFAWEVAQIAAKRTGQAIDPRNVDFTRFRDGLNFSDISLATVERLKEYVLRRVELAQYDFQTFDEQGRNISQWRNIRPQDIEFQNITWGGIIKGRIRVIDQFADYYYSPVETALLHSAFTVGALLSIYPIFRGIKSLGCRKTFAIVASISTIATVLCPLAASFAFVLFILMRILQGVGFASCFPVIGCVLHEWPRISENSFFIGILSAFIQIAVIIESLLTGFSCALIGWQFAYYFQALISGLMIGAWWLVFRDNPGEHSKVSIAELRLIQEGKVIDAQKRHNTVKISTKQLCMDKNVWAIWLAFFGNMLSMLLIILFFPIYYEILGKDIICISILMAILAFAQFCVKVTVCVEKIHPPTSFTNAQKSCLLNSIAFFGAALIFFILTIISSVHPFLVVLLLSLLGFNVGGFYKSAATVERQYFHSITASFQIVITFAAVIATLLVFLFSQNKNANRWAFIFATCAIAFVTTNVAFCIIILQKSKTPSKAREQRPENTDRLIEKDPNNTKPEEDNGGRV